MALANNQIEMYRDTGYLCPVNAFTEEQALELRTSLEQIEAEATAEPGQIAAIKNNSNWVVPFFDQLSRTPEIIDAVCDLLGPNVLALNVDLFIKEARSPQFISWHQDLHYWGLDSDNVVTAWLALSPATRDSGCMRFVPGSHKTPVDHQDTFAGDNMLSRGQEVAVEVDEADAIYAELQPGQMSLHHGRLLHASTANVTDDRRIGLAIRYITPEVGRASEGARLGASLVAGRDTHGHFQLVPPPNQAFEPGAMENWQQLRAVEEEILFAGLEK